MSIRVCVASADKAALIAVKDIYDNVDNNKQLTC